MGLERGQKRTPEALDNRKGIKADRPTEKTAGGRVNWIILSSEDQRRISTWENYYRRRIKGRPGVSNRRAARPITGA